MAINKQITRRGTARGTIAIAAYEVPRSIGDGRPSVLAGGGALSHSVSTSRLGAAAATLLINGCLIATFMLLDPLYLRPLALHRAGEASTLNGVIYAQLIEESTRVVLHAEPLLASPVLRARRVFTHTNSADAKRVSAPGDETYSRGALATAIAIATPEEETARLRAIYRERIAQRLARDAILTTGVSRTHDCIVSIVQKSSGEIVDVEILRCAGSETWKRSVAKAIRAATPLPAPPREDVFQRQITVQMSPHLEVL